MKYKIDIPKMTSAKYAVDVSWGLLESQLSRYAKDYGLDMDPDFQREYVWTEQQQIDYVEWILRGGRSGRDIYFNCPNWSSRSRQVGTMVLVDGKQRLKAVLAFLNNEIPAYGTYFEDFEDKDLIVREPIDLSFRFHINDLRDRVDVLQWYINMNTGGTQHTTAEIEKVKRLLEQEKINQCQKYRG